MIAGAKYGHTNLIAKDWKSLARFYEEQFGCIPVPPERGFKGPDLERGTRIPGAELRGVHLRLPGHGPEGPTLEIFNYNILEAQLEIAVNRPGFGHIAFVVDDVPSAREAVLAAGGQPVGDVVTLTTATGAKVTWVYVTDPEGNVIELQSWSKLLAKTRKRGGSSPPLLGATKTPMNAPVVPLKRTMRSLVPFVEDERTVFLKTIIPSRKATKEYLGEESHED